MLFITIPKLALWTQNLKVTSSKHGLSVKLTTKLCPVSWDENVMSLPLGLSDTWTSVDFMNKGNLTFHNNADKDGVFHQSKNNSSWNAWPSNMGQIYCPETSITNILCRVKSKKSEGLNYSATGSPKCRKESCFRLCALRLWNTRDPKFISHSAKKSP